MLYYTDTKESDMTTNLTVHVINSGYGTDDGLKEVDVQAFKMDSYNRPYCIVSHPYIAGDSCRAEFRNDEWVVDFD
jgi:hypothetical protein